MDVGVQLDSGGSPDFNSGFFENGVLQGEDGVGGREVKVSLTLSPFPSSIPSLTVSRFRLASLQGDWEWTCPHCTSSLTLSLLRCS